MLEFLSKAADKAEHLKASMLALLGARISAHAQCPNYATPGMVGDQSMRVAAHRFRVRIGWGLATPWGGCHRFRETLALWWKAAWNRNNCDGLVDYGRKV
jgi:hypothetical protein